MGRFMYQHFGDDVPRHIEAEYNRMLRREQYLEEREAEFRAMSADFNAVQEVMPDPATLVNAEQLCEMLDLKYKTVCKFVREGKIPRMPDGRKIRVAKIEVINYVLQRAQNRL